MTLAIVPARAGSKGLPGKNGKRINGSSLVQIAIGVAVESRVCDLTVLTSDDPLLLAQAERAGALALRRPAYLSTDRSSSMAAIRHAVRTIERTHNMRCDPIVVLAPTAPLRSVADIRTAIKLNSRPDRPNVVGASYLEDVDWIFQMRPNGSIRWARTARRERRQDQTRAYVPNGVIYVLTRERLDRPWWERAVAYVVPKARALEIDDAGDLEIARAIAGMRPRPKTG